MRGRVLGAIVLFCMVYALPFVCLAPVSIEDFQSITTLDVCNMGVSVDGNSAPSEITPFFNVSFLTHFQMMSFDDSMLKAEAPVLSIDRPPIG